MAFWKKSLKEDSFSEVNNDLNKEKNRNEYNKEQFGPIIDSKQKNNSNVSLKDEINTYQRLGDTLNQTGESEHITKINSEGYIRYRSAISEGTVIQGRLSFDSSVKIDGSLFGEVYSSKVLVIGKSGCVEASSIEAEVLVVFGKVIGDIKASKKVEVYAGGSVQGTVTTPSLFLEEGSSFEATCKMEKPNIIVENCAKLEVIANLETGENLDSGVFKVLTDEEFRDIEQFQERIQ